MIAFFVPGLAKPKGSTKAFAFRRANGKLGAAVTSDNPAEKSWRLSVADQARAAMAEARSLPWELPCSLRLVFVMPRPKSHYRANGELREASPRTPAVKPDLDKLVRSIGDALAKVVYRDDALVAQLVARKVYPSAAYPHVGVHVAAWPWKSNASVATRTGGVPRLK